MSKQPIAGPIDMARRILTRFAGLRMGERVVILAETEANAAIKRAFHRAVRELADAHVSLVTYDRQPPYTRPPEPVPHAVVAADLVMALDIYLSHTRLEQTARASSTSTPPAWPQSNARSLTWITS